MTNRTTISTNVEALREALREWDALTDEQRAAELETATDRADALVRIMEWNAPEAVEFARRGVAIADRLGARPDRYAEPLPAVERYGTAEHEAMLVDLERRGEL